MSFKNLDSTLANSAVVQKPCKIGIAPECKGKRAVTATKTKNHAELIIWYMCVISFFQFFLYYNEFNLEIIYRHMNLNFLFILFSAGWLGFQAQAALSPADTAAVKEMIRQEFTRFDSMLWGMEVRIMYLERNGSTPGGHSLMPLRSPGALVRRNETLRRRGGGLSDSGLRASPSSRETEEAERESYFPPS